MCRAVPREVAWFHWTTRLDQKWERTQHLLQIGSDLTWYCWYLNGGSEGAEQSSMVPILWWLLGEKEAVCSGGISAAIFLGATDVICVQINSGQERSSRQERTMLPVLAHTFARMAGFSWLTFVLFIFYSEASLLSMVSRISRGDKG